MAEMLAGKKKDAEKEKNTATLSKISNAIKGSEKLDVEGTDLLELLSHLEGELQARDVAIAALKSEQLKRVVYGVYQGTDRPASPVSALQRDKATGEDAGRIEEETRGAGSLAEAQILALQQVVERQRVAAQKMAACLRESEKQRALVSEELQEERAKHEQDTAQGDDITYQLEKERIRLRQDLEVEVVEKQKLEAALKENMSSLEEEKSKQKQIVLVLLADRKKLMKLYLEEKKRSEDLAQMLGEEKTKMDTMAAGLEEESKRSLAMEAELEKHLSQFGSERQQLRDKLVTDERRQRELEDSLRKARLDVEHFKKQLSEAHRVAMSQAAPPPPYPTPSILPPPLSVSPTPRPQPPLQPQYSAQPFPPYSSTYHSPGGAAPSLARQTSMATTATVAAAGRPPGLSPGSTVARAPTGSMPGHPAVQAGGGQAKFHSSTYTPNSTAGGYGHTSHPALIPAGLPSHSGHMDQEAAAGQEGGSQYSQLATKPGPPKAAPVAPLAPGRKPLADSAAQANARKPALGKGVPPPLPPNKPVVPVKKDLGGLGGKRPESGGKEVSVEVGAKVGPPGGSLVSGLQGLKFGISISQPDAAKGLKPGLGEGHPAQAPNIPTKKFFNNIESKS